MNNLIFNEKEYVKELLRVHDITQCNITPYKLIYYLVIWYYQEYGVADKKKLEKYIDDELKNFNICDYYFKNIM